ncbi:MAG TPA: cytochrome P450 [Jatrophihabitantaceae bacterium]
MSISAVTARRPPGPDGDRDLRAMRDAPLEFLTEMVSSYGHVTSHHTDGELVYLVNRADLVRYVLKENNTNYSKDRTPDDTMLRPLLGNGLLTSSGADWARQRHLCAPAFRPGVVAGFDGVITEAATHLADRWATSSGPLRVDHDFTSLTLTVIVRAMLGADLLGIGEGFGRAVDAVNRFIGHYVPSEDNDPVDTAQRRGDFRQAQQFLNMVTQMIIAARRADPNDTRSDLLAAMISSMSDAELREQVLTIIMAGHETTAKALTWTVYLLDQHPEAASAVYAEVDRVLGGRVPTAADLPSLVECRWAIEEAMRLYPPVWLISRRAVGADVVGGYDVDPGTLICISPYVLHRDARYWTDPLEYRPARFAPSIAAERPSHAYVPFGGGPRICIGQHLALVEAVLVLATVASRLRLQLVPGHPVEPEALVTMRPRHGMVMTAAPR